MVKKKVVKKRVISEKEKELKQVLVACGKSARHWEKDMLGKGLTPHGGDCALCILNGDDDCVGCIVGEFTESDCQNTGFDTYLDIQDLLDRNNICGDIRVKLILMKDIAAKVEINFLKALKVLTAERLRNERLKNKLKER